MPFDFHPFLCDPDEKAMIDLRLAGMEIDAVLEICKDKKESLNTRFFGATRLPPAHRSRLFDCLVLDCNDVLWTSLSILISPSDTPQLRATLRRYFDECDDEFRFSALHLLAEFGDESVFSIAEDLLTGTSRVDRLLAVACLRKLGTDSAYAALRKYWGNTNHPLDTRLRVAGILLQDGESEPLSFLLETAREDTTEAAYASLMSIYHHHDKALGLKLMRGILSSKEHGAHDVTLHHVANLMRDQSIRDRPDGVNLAQEWLESQYRTR